jgi:hypothetical protein
VRPAILARPIAGLTAVVCCLVIGYPVVVCADELAKLSNASFGLTLLDMATTRLSIEHTNGSETNPIARPFVRSDAGAIGYAVLTTALERIVFRKHPRALIGVAGVEAYASIRNYTDRLHALALTRAAEGAQAQR